MRKNKLGLVVTILTLTQSVGFAQDYSSPNASAEIYEINGFSAFAPLKISGSFIVKNPNNDELIDKSKLSDFKLTLIYGGIIISCPLSALNKFQISDSQHFLHRYRRLGEFAPKEGVPVGWGIVNLELSCQGKDAQFSISSSQSPIIKVKIKTRNNHYQTEQKTDSSGMQIAYSAGISRQTVEFDAPLYRVSIKPINQNIFQSNNIQTSSDSSNIQRVSLNKSFILTEGKNAKIYTKEWRGLVTGYEISIINNKNNHAEIKISKFEEYPRTLSNTIGQHTLSLSEANTITPSKLILGDGYALKFVGFTSSGVELIVVYAR